MADNEAKFEDVAQNIGNIGRPNEATTSWPDKLKVSDGDGAILRTESEIATVYALKGILNILRDQQRQLAAMQEIVDGLKLWMENNQ